MHWALRDPPLLVEPIHQQENFHIRHLLDLPEEMTNYGNVEYRAPSAYNDIALVKLDRTVTFTRFIKSACLYTNSYIAPDTTLIATGWGLTKFAGQPSERLQEVDLNLFSEQECNETYSNIAGSRKLRFGILSDSQVCAGGRTVAKDTCQGDSGGPLQVYLDDKRIYSIVGVTSFGKACGSANVPGVYSRKEILNIAASKGRISVPGRCPSGFSGGRPGQNRHPGHQSPQPPCGFRKPTEKDDLQYAKKWWRRNSKPVLSTSKTVFLKPQVFHVK
ncbi:snake [Carabus blaptoides fortunei]